MGEMHVRQAFDLQQGFSDRQPVKAARAQHVL